MFTGEENETVGPKVGIKLNNEQVNCIVKRHFPNTSVTNISHINRGYNNRVYIVTTSNNQEFVLRLGGRFWTRYKTENEVVALLTIAKRCRSLPVPNIFGYCTDKTKSGVHVEYIIMEKIKGDPLDSVWDDLSLKEKMNITSQMAKLFSKIQGIRFQQIGSFQFEKETIGESHGIGIDPEIDFQTENIWKVGRGVEFDGGPFNTFIEYFKSTCETEIEYLKNCEFMKESEGYCERLQRIEKFVRAFETVNALPEGISKEAMENVPFVFTHGDLEPRNLLVDKETLQITGILDWEFAGSYPVDEEWFSGFAFVDGDTSDWRVFNEARPALDCMNDDEKQSFNPEMINLLREHFFEQMRKNEVAVPDDIPGHMIRAELYYFRGFICPWWLREEQNPIPDTHYNDRSNACQKVDRVLGKYGF